MEANRGSPGPRPFPGIPGGLLSLTYRSAVVVQAVAIRSAAIAA
ncbi:hypothetical protein [Paeniglutamicibacter sp. NPDC091659]